MIDDVETHASVERDVALGRCFQPAHQPGGVGHLQAGPKHGGADALALMAGTGAHRFEEQMWSVRALEAAGLGVDGGLQAIAVQRPRAISQLGEEWSIDIDS